MKELYLMPSNQPSDGQAGSVTRRNVPWKYAGSESEGTDHIIRILSSSYNSFDRVNSHTIYIEPDIEPEPAPDPVFLFSFAGRINQIFTPPDLSAFVECVGTLNQPSHDIKSNPQDYHFLINGVLSLHTSQTQWHKAGGYNMDDSRVFIAFDNAMIVRINLGEVVPSSPYTVNLEVFHFGVSIGSVVIALTLNGGPYSSADQVLTNIVGDFFGGAVEA